MGIQINGNTNNINAGIGSLSIEDINELDIVGVATAANFKTGVSNLHNVGLTLSGGQIDVGSNIKLGNAGVITATSFVGSGANLTGLPAGTTINNNANNRLITGSGTANTLEGEANLTFDGTTLTNENGGGAANLSLKATSNSFNSLILDSNRSADTQFAIIDGRWNGNVVNRIQFVTGSDGTNKDDGYMAFHTRTSGASLGERLRITSNGNLLVNQTSEFGSAIKLQVRGASSAISDGAQIFDITTTASATGGTRLAFGVNEDTYAWIRSYESGVGSRDLVFAGVAEYGRFTSDGKLGIGTDNPATKVHIYDASADPYLKIGGSGRDCGIQLDAANSFTAMRTDAADRLWINAKYDGIYFTTGGTSSSNTRLKIDTSGHLTLQGGKIYGEDNASNVLFLQSTSGNGNHSRIEIGASQSSDNGGIHFYTAGSSTATRHMTLKGTSGNLGLAVDNPDTKLHIVHANAAEDVLKIEAKPVSAGTGAKSKIIFQITQSNNQSARLAEIHSLAENGWGGGLAFNVKQSNSTPNNSTEEALRINSSDSAATNLRLVVDAYLQMGGYNNTNESFANLAVLFSARDMAGGTLVSGQTDTISGYALRRTTSDGSGTFFFGPYGAFPAGDYTALFRMKVANRSGSSNVETLDVTGNGMELQGRNYAPNSSARSIQLQTNDFTESNKYQYFAIDFSKQNSAAHIETRCLSYAGNTDIYLDHVLILPRINHGFEGGSGVFDY